MVDLDTFSAKIECIPSKIIQFIHIYASLLVRNKLKLPFSLAITISMD